MVHALALATFDPPYERVSCLEIKPTSTGLSGHAPGIEDSPAGRSVAARHETWASRLPREADQLWAFVQGLGSSDLLDLLAHCASLTVNAVRSSWDRRPGAWAHADRLAGAAVGLEWRPIGRRRWTPRNGTPAKGR